MTGHPNAAPVMRALKAFGERDSRVLAETLSADAVWHVGGNNPVSGDYHGAREIVQCQEELLELVANSARVRPHDTLASDDHVVVLAGVAASRHGRDYTGNLLYLFHVHDDHITEGWVVQHNQQAWDDFLNATPT